MNTLVQLDKVTKKYAGAAGLPLNEISERRIFEAIAALTGIDHEPENERWARRHEYDRQQAASSPIGPP